jgi:hypothetical protein
LQTDDRIPAGTRIMVGIDFGFHDDTTAIVPMWVRGPNDRLFGDPVVLQPPGDGTMLDVNDIKAAISEVNERWPIEVAVCDPYGAQDIMQWVANELGATVVVREQTNAWAIEDFNQFTEAIREGWIHHTGDPTFRRHALSAIRARLPGDRYRFDRPRTLRKAGAQQRRVVIDALTAAAMVNSAAATVSPSVYEDRGLALV